ncbi:hypothetical protein [Coriobacterium glomerans]|uniref:hypothetical protein n=1 Tax=Coriobacterium glomerans TaxID=33871 RepID=UPI0002F4F6A1|nr:hypothetical protein [Coriobacterium glomerans]
MYIKTLRIHNTISECVMREVSFHQGVNIIVDAEDSRKQNKVGKTTFLKLIDVLMGAKNRKNVYANPGNEQHGYQAERYHHRKARCS